MFIVRKRLKTIVRVATTAVLLHATISAALFAQMTFVLLGLTAVAVLWAGRRWRRGGVGSRRRGPRRRHGVGTSGVGPRARDHVQYPLTSAVTVPMFRLCGDAYTLVLDEAIFCGMQMDGEFVPFVVEWFWTLGVDDPRLGEGIKR